MGAGAERESRLDATSTARADERVRSHHVAMWAMAAIVLSAVVGGALESGCTLPAGDILTGISFLSVPLIGVAIVGRLALLVVTRRRGWTHDPTLWTLVGGLALVLLLDVWIGTNFMTWSDDCTPND